MTRLKLNVVSCGVDEDNHIYGYRWVDALPVFSKIYDKSYIQLLHISVMDNWGTYAKYVVPD